MESKSLGKTNLTIPEIGLGTLRYRGGVEPLRKGIRWPGHTEIGMRFHKLVNALFFYLVPTRNKILSLSAGCAVGSRPKHGTCLAPTLPLTLTSTPLPAPTVVPVQVPTSVVDPTPTAIPFPTATPELTPKRVPGTSDRVQKLWARTKGMALP